MPREMHQAHIIGRELSNLVEERNRRVGMEFAFRGPEGNLVPTASHCDIECALFNFEKETGSHWCLLKNEGYTIVEIPESTDGATS